MPSSISIARAAATLPRSWSKPFGIGQGFNVDPRISKRQEGANKTRLILQAYLKQGIEPSPEVLDSLDPTNFSCDGTLSSKGSVDSLRLSSASNERKVLVRKQTRRQKLLPSFFEPLLSHRKSKASKADTPAAAPVALTTAALNAHDNPAAAFLATPSAPAIRRSVSFAGPILPIPTIRIIKPEPECLDDHSNPSSRDPFYYDKVLKGIETHCPRSPPRQQPPKPQNPQKRQQRSRTESKDSQLDSSVESGAVTAWFAEHYL
ncbi:hypothetical protein O181_012970 [Austropuccinia psidii MF-1]|uniref:Uncharacterized protein n=1 Tax=Austropuccinia psidii MF-1 TaxID=1389203 RepID=A0A9Q3BY44_9BASI|nr:hypothetical protein [Austropuccinia psidii MF-1]